MIFDRRLSFRPWAAFTFVEAIFTIAVIGIMSALAVSAISNGARDANRILARQQQAAVNEALTSWVMSQTRVGSTAQVRSLKNLRTQYNALGTSLARFNLLVPNPSSADPNVRNGYLDKTTTDHFLEHTSNSDRLQTKAMKGSGQYLALPVWQEGGFPTVELVNE
jgi:type II secretory pathway pseudopilin PulG